MGVWDTVGSVYGTIDALEIKDTSLPTTIDIALHAVSLQENRKKFLPTLWTSPPGGIGSGQVLKQVNIQIHTILTIVTELVQGVVCGSSF